MRDKAGPSVKDDRVTSRIITDLKSRIADGRLRPGERLATERELAEEFGVNRASVRQVLKVLETMGILTQRVGDGTYLSLTAENILDEPIEFLLLLEDIRGEELFQTRILMEPELAARAAERADSGDIGALARAIEDLRSSTSSTERVLADLSFHDAVYRASGDRICQILFKRLHRVTMDSMMSLSGIELERPLHFHERIASAIRAHDPETARRIMREHLEDANARYVTLRKRRSRAPRK
jgi:GntR family transcriptional repressor for pyruvate dehydrogenase complex